LLQDEVKDLQKKFNEAVKDLIQWQNRCGVLQNTLAKHGLLSENQDIEVMHQLGQLMMEKKIVTVIDQRVSDEAGKQETDVDEKIPKNGHLLEKDSAPDTASIETKAAFPATPNPTNPTAIVSAPQHPIVSRKEIAIQAEIKQYVANEAQTISAPEVDHTSKKFATSRDFFEKALKAQEDLALRLEKQLSNTRNELESLKLGAPDQEFWMNNCEQSSYPYFKTVTGNNCSGSSQGDSHSKQTKAYTPISQGLNNWINDRQQLLKLYQR